MSRRVIAKPSTLKRQIQLYEMYKTFFPWVLLRVLNFLTIFVLAASILRSANCKSSENLNENSHINTTDSENINCKYRFIPPVLGKYPYPIVILMTSPINRTLTTDFLKNEIYHNGSSTTTNSTKDMPFCQYNSSESAEKVKIFKNVTTDEALMDKLQTVLGPDLGGIEMGGHWKPSNCVSREKMAIIVPYKDRLDNLREFLVNLHPFLQEQQIDYRIFVVEQADVQLVNNGMLRNIGFVEAYTLENYNCFIFYDVCNIPEEKSIFFKCSNQPVHFTGIVSSYGYKMPYPEYFGGVVGFRPNQFIKVNGYSNEFWGWGQEDDDMFYRIGKHGLKVEHYPGRFFRMKHEDGKTSDGWTRILHGRAHYNTNGVDTLNYNILAIDLTKLYTWIYVELPKQG